MIESLISQIVDLKRQLDENMAGSLIDGSEPTELNDGNDGTFYKCGHALVFYGNKELPNECVMSDRRITGICWPFR